MPGGDGRRALNEADLGAPPTDAKRFCPASYASAGVTSHPVGVDAAAALSSHLQVQIGGGGMYATYCAAQVPNKILAGTTKM